MASTTPEARKKGGTVLLTESSEGSYTAYTLISNFWPPERETDWCSSPQFVVGCYSPPSKLIYILYAMYISIH